MDLEFYIAKKIHFTSDFSDKRISRLASRIAVCGIAVGLVVIILSFAIVIGFKKEVSNKIYGFGSHIHIASSFDESTYEPSSICIDSVFFDRLNEIDFISDIQEVITQPGILCKNDEFQAVVFKGVDKNYNSDFFCNNLMYGEFISFPDSLNSSEVIISKKNSDLLNIKIGDKFISYFIIDGKVRARSFWVKGIYSTGFSEYDKIFVICDIRNIRKLRNWKDSECGGLELLVKNPDEINVAYEKVFSSIGNRFDENGSSLSVKTIRELNPQMFSWLDLLDLNVIIIMILMCAVAGFAIISGVLILILEKLSMIGILKSMGMSNFRIKKVFIYRALFLLTEGMIIGNMIALILCYIQKKYSFVTLNPDVYYVESVPISLSLSSLIYINVFVFFVMLFVVIFPSYVVSKISIVKTLKFE